MKNDIILKNFLRITRKEKRLSQGSLAELVGVSRQTINAIETGRFCPTAKLALLLCLELDKKFEDLFYFEEYLSKEPTGDSDKDLNENSSEDLGD